LFFNANITDDTDHRSSRRHGLVIARSACDEAIQGRGTVLAALDRHAAKRRLAMTEQPIKTR
jgi:hypothetical protein